MLFNDNKDKNHRDNYVRTSSGTGHINTNLPVEGARGQLHKSDSNSNRREALLSRAIADMVLDTSQNTALLHQSVAEENYASQRPSTPLLSESAASELEVPSSTPLSHSVRNSTTMSFGGAVDAILEGVTYDAILASTVNKSLGVGEDEFMLPPPETKAPPNSPVGTAHCGQFGSLVEVTMAIMEKRI